VVIKPAARAAILLLPPALLLFTLFVVLPVGQAAWYSFFRWDGFGSPTDFVGWRNYEEVFASPVFHTALSNNALIIVVSLLVQLPLAVAVALVLVERVPGAPIFRLVYFLPYVLAEIAAGLIWRFVYDGDAGLVAQGARALGQEPPWVLAEPGLAQGAILTVITWKYFGFHMMLFIAGLQGIDRDLYAAARVDGATRWQVLRFIQLPLLVPTIKLSVFFAVLGSLQLFDLIMPLTGGGPSDSTQTMVSFLYSHGITRMRVGFGSAIGVVLFVMCLAFAFGYQRWVMREPGGAR
jgi:raffinose/stachyose/melibiose transport system permease protein